MVVCMCIVDIKAKFLDYYDREINEIKKLNEDKVYLRSGYQSRELLGIIQFFWYYDIINDDERDKCFNEVYDYKIVAEIYLKHLI